jgi:hypothetical protein
MRLQGLKDAPFIIIGDDVRIDAPNPICVIQVRNQ